MNQSINKRQTDARILMLGSIAVMEQFFQTKSIHIARNSSAQRNCPAAHCM